MSFCVLKAMLEELKRLGLTEVEAKVYLALLDEGPSVAGRISRRSGIHRRMVYDACERLIEKGLVGYILRNNRRFFEAVSPERLLELVKEKEESVNAILPQLMLKFRSSRERQETNFYKGQAGLKTVFEQQLREAKEILIIGASSFAYELFPFYFKWYDKRRIERKIKAKILFSVEARKGLKEIPYAKIKFLPTDFSTPAATNIWADKVAIIFWSRENPFAVVIKQKEIADAYRKYFSVLWAFAKFQESC